MVNNRPPSKNRDSGHNQQGESGNGQGRAPGLKGYPSKDRGKPNGTTRRSGRISTQLCVKRPSKDVLLTPFKSCLRGGHNSTFSISAMTEDDSIPIPDPVNRGAAARATKQGSSNANQGLSPFSNNQMDIDHFSDTLSDKYPSPEKSENDPNKGHIAVLVVQTLSKYIFLEDAENVELAMRSLRNLSINTKEHVMIAKAGGIREALTAMERFPTKILIQQLGLLFLGDISRTSSGNKLHIGQSGGLQLINRILNDVETTDFALLERSCITLRVVCRGCEFNALLTGVCGTIDAVLKTMRRWKRSATLQERCLDCLTTIVHEAPENAVLMTDTGGTSEILLTIRQYSTDIDVQTAGLRAACEISKANEAARDNIGCSGILSDIGKGLDSFPNSGEYIIYASRCLRYIAFSASNRERIIRTSLHAVLVSRMEQWRTYREVTSSILQCLANVTFDSEEGKRTAARNGGITVILATLEAYQHDSAMCSNACRLLRNLSDGCVATKRVIGKHGTIARVIGVLQQHESDGATQEHGCAMLINLLVTSESQVRNAGLEKHLVLMQDVHATNERARKQIDFLLSKLQQQSRGNSTTRVIKQRLGSGHGSHDAQKLLSDKGVARVMAAVTGSADVMDY